MAHVRPKHEPTPEEIEAEMAAIREERRQAEAKEPKKPPSWKSIYRHPRVYRLG